MFCSHVDHATAACLGPFKKSLPRPQRSRVKKYRLTSCNFRVTSRIFFNRHHFSSFAHAWIYRGRSLKINYNLISNILCLLIIMYINLPWNISLDERIEAIFIDLILNSSNLFQPRQFSKRASSSWVLSEIVALTLATSSFKLASGLQIRSSVLLWITFSDAEHWVHRLSGPSKLVADYRFNNFKAHFSMFQIV